MKISLALFAALMTLSACAGNKKELAQIASLRSDKSGLQSQVKELQDKAAALDAAKAESEGKAKELAEKLEAAQGQIDSLQDSNAALSKSLEANKGDMAAQLRKTIAEKDKLAKSLADEQKARSAVEREKARVDRQLSTLAGRLALSKQAADSYEKQLDAAKADAAAKEKDRSARLAQTHEDMGRLADAALKEIEAEQAFVEQKGETFELTLREPLLFEPQKAKLTEAGTALLDRVGAALRALPPRPVRVEAHSDNSKIKWELFGSFTSHWDLTAARATAVARYLHEHAGLDPHLLTASGFGEFRPLKGNDTPEGRAANRRVVIAVEGASR